MFNPISGEETNVGSRGPREARPQLVLWMSDLLWTMWSTEVKRDGHWRDIHGHGVGGL